MQVIQSIKTFQSTILKAKKDKKKIGFVPTMGDFHEGHLSLMRRCRKENDLTVVSIFVNPLQFGPHEDFKQYPRHFTRDVRLAKKENVDIIFHPSEKIFAPRNPLAHLDTEQLSKHLCGRYRNGHFQGVATIVHKFLNIVQPQILYLGQKDAQQAQILYKMIRDLRIPCRVKICPIVREKDGLALSSRNRFLSPAQRKQAPTICQSLKKARQLIVAGERKPQKIRNMIKQNLQRNTRSRIQYIECVDARTLTPLNKLQGNILIAVAVFFGETRLIDNISVNIR